MGKSGQEDSLITAFNKRFNRMAWQRNKEVLAIATDGNDRHMLADFIFGDEALWTLVEFKSWSTSGRTAEERKPKSLALCRAIAAESAIRRLHDQVHFAGFGAGPGLYFSVYREHFCAADPSRSVTDQGFLEAFYGRTIGLAPQEADFYIRWLLDLDDGSGGGQSGRALRLLIDTGTDQTLMRDFSSTLEASEWVESIKPYSPGPAPPTSSPPSA
jgi:hypothetical protein